VETEECWHRLAAMGCDLAQGYWIARPLPSRQLRQWLVANDWGLRFK
jgi:EAL domain-containing protein (putative c-di-GMP-specific phosphodiesterase class I)